MNWKNMTIGKKIGTGFSVVILLLVILGVISFTGVGGIVKNASEVIDGTSLDGELAQKEVDHLNWIMEVNKLLTDASVHELRVQTDHTQCGFGQWLYGEGRKDAETLVPTLSPLFKEIEDPHRLLHESAIAIDDAYREADPGLPGFLAVIEVKHLQWAASIQDAILDNWDKISVQTDHTLCGFGKWLYGEQAKKTADSDAVLARLIQEVKAPHQTVHDSASRIISVYQKIHPGLLQTLQLRLDDHRKWASTVAQSVIKQSQVRVQTDPQKCGFGKWLDSEEVTTLVSENPALGKILTAVSAPHEALHASAVQIDDAIRSGNMNGAVSIFENKTQLYLEKVAGLIEQAIQYENTLTSGRNQAIEIFKNETTPALEKTRELLGELSARSQALLQGKQKASDLYTTQTAPNLKKVQKTLGDIRQEASSHIMTDKAMLAAAQSTRRNVSIVAVIAILVGVFLAFIIARGIVSVLQTITVGMGEGANQVAAASGQVSSSSQSMAEGASEQAASIEETSSSMEEMSSMTKRNAENAGNADSLMKEANHVVKAADESMDQLIISMEDISKASEETSKIIKTIDEIAFQTNLLALNAAVEAARAGEAGAGFAVVADEVRNLAMRAADAAKSTAQLIEGTVKKVNDGSQLVITTNEAFTQVAQSSAKVGGLIAEISEASKEQSEGISQVNNAITEMDKVVQQNAANAEESASAAEEMNAQAEQLREYVADLMMMVTGKKDPAVEGHAKRSIKRVGGGLTPSQGKKKMLAHGTKEVRPDQVIPFDDDEDFENF